MRIFIIGICALFLTMGSVWADTHSSPSTESGNVLSQLPKNGFGYAQINVNQLKQVLAVKNFPLINVHIPLTGGIPNTDANIAYNRIDLVVARYPDKEQPLVIYCRSGSMSKAASRQLVSLGYKNVIEVLGGYNAWMNAGNPLE